MFVLEITNIVQNIDIFILCCFIKLSCQSKTKNSSNFLNSTTILIFCLCSLIFSCVRRGHRSISCVILHRSFPWVLRQGPPLNLKLTNSIRLKNGQATVIFLFQPLSTRIKCTCLGSVWCTTSDLLTCVTSTSKNVLYLKPVLHYYLKIKVCMSYYSIVQFYCVFHLNLMLL